MHIGLVLRCKGNLISHLRTRILRIRKLRLKTFARDTKLFSLRIELEKYENSELNL